MLNIQPSNRSRQEQTHFFTRNVNQYHHDCPLCNQQFNFTQSQFTQNAAAMSRSGLHQGPPVVTNMAICDNPTCVVCAGAPPKMIDELEVYEYQRNLATPCAICGDNSFAKGQAPYNTLTLRASQFVKAEPGYVTRSLGPQQSQVWREQIRTPDQGSFIQQESYDYRSPQVSIGDRVIIKTPKTEYRDVMRGTKNRCLLNFLFF